LTGVKFTCACTCATEKTRRKTGKNRIIKPDY
jgi:hypothetical protein